MGAGLFQLKLKNSDSQISIDNNAAKITNGEETNPDADIEPPYTGPVIAPLKIGDKSIEFPYTDDTSNEDLIIKSDRKYYNAFSGGDAYFSVTNNSNVDE